MRFAALAMMVALASGCGIGRPVVVAPNAGQLVIGQTFEPVAKWSCELGEELVLTKVEGRYALHVASIDVLLTDHWEDEHFRYFSLDYAGVATGSVYRLPMDVNEDAVIDQYARIGGHEPINPSGKYPDGSPLPRMKKFAGMQTASDGSRRPLGDPWGRDICWSPSGPLAKTAKEKGVRPEDLLLFGAHHDSSPPPKGAIHVVVEGCVASTEGPSPLQLTGNYWIEPEKGGKLYLDELPKVVVDAPKASADGCALAFVDGKCRNAHVLEETSEKLYYWERVDTGYELFWEAKNRRGLLRVYSPGDLRPAPPPPQKTDPAGPLSTDSKAHAFDCVLREAAK